MLAKILKQKQQIIPFLCLYLFGFAEPVLQLYQVGVIKEIVDCAVNSDYSIMVIEFVVLFCLVLLTILIRATTIYFHDIFTIRFRNKLSICLFDRFISSKYMGLKEMHSADVMNRIVLDMGSVTSFFADTLPKVLSNTILLIGAFSYLLEINYKIAICLIVISPLFALCSKKFYRGSNRYAQGIKELESTTQSFFQELIQNRLVAIINRTVDYVIDKFSSLLSKLELMFIANTCFKIRMIILLSTGFNMLYLTTLVWGCILLSRKLMTVGELAAILQLSDKILNSLRSLSELIPAGASFRVARKRLYAIYDLQIESLDTMKLEGELGIVFNNVTYSYPYAKHHVLENFSVNILPGKFTILKGRSGGGKTTLVNLILGIYTPDEGCIYIQDSHGKQIITNAVRDYIEYVPQESRLLQGTIEENLALANPNATTEEMKEALNLACADFIFGENMNGLLTQCAEKGVGFSLGQVQRILIARALVRKRPLLILDESTSALDDKTEKKLLSNLRLLMTRTPLTVLFVTHKSNLETKDDVVITL